MKFKNGTEIKDGDKVVGVDHRNVPCAGVAVKGSPALGQDEYVFKNNAHGAVQSSLSLTKFLREDEKDWKPEAEKPAAAATSAAATSAASTAP